MATPLIRKLWLTHNWPHRMELILMTAPAASEAQMSPHFAATSRMQAARQLLEA
jgi:hypothetical protein